MKSSRLLRMPLADLLSHATEIRYEVQANVPTPYFGGSIRPDNSSKTRPSRSNVQQSGVRFV